MEELLIKARAIELIRNQRNAAIRKRFYLIFAIGIALGAGLIGVLELLL